MDRQTELLAAETLLQRGVKVQIVAPLLLRLFGKRFIKITIRQPCYGTLLRISSYYLRTGVTANELDSISIENAMKVAGLHGKTLSKAIATAVLNGYLSGMLFTDLLACYLRWKLTPKQMCAFIEILAIYGGVEAFMSTTRLLGSQIVTPPNQGQKKQGS